MEIRTHVAWFSTTVVLASAFFIVMSDWHDDETPAQTVAPNLFPFIKSTENVPEGANVSAQPADADIQQAQPVSVATTLTPAQVALVEESVQAMRKQGASDDEIYRRRAASLNAEAAAQLASMEREEAIWKARVDAYHAERNRLLSGAVNLSAIDQEHALRAWKNARFTTDEQVRLTAHESYDIPRLTLP